MDGDLLVHLHKDGDERVIQFNNDANCTFTVTREAFVRLTEHLIKFEKSDDTTAFCLLDAIDYEDEHDLRLACLREAIEEIEADDEEI